MNSTQLAEIVYANLAEYRTFGIRVVDFDGPVNVGDVLPPSFVWDDGDQTDEALDGTCAVEIEHTVCAESAEKIAEEIETSLKIARAYWGDRVTLIAGWYAQPGVDRQETVIRDAAVLAVWAR